MKRLFLIAVLFCLSVSSAYAATGFNVIPIIAVNNTSAALTTPRIPWNLSSTALVSGSWMNSTGLNTEVQEGSTAIGYMPGTDRVRMLACFNNAGGNETTACNNATADDITFPVLAAQVYEFAADSQFRHLWLNISTAAVGANWDLAWEYYNGAAYVALSNVTDGTSELTLSGLRQVTWSFPAEGLWDEAALHGVTGYWMRIRVSAFTALPTSPLGQQAYYETGRWWTVTSTLATAEQKRFDLHLDTTAEGNTTTTFSVGTSADDTILQGVDAAYPPTFDLEFSTGTTARTDRTLSGGNYTVQDIFLRFNTAALPDQISPDSGSLQCHVSDTRNVNARELVGDWYNWSGTLGSKDYNTTAANHAISGVDITAITVGAVNTWTLQNLHQINKAGYTGIKLSVSGGIPTGLNYVQIATFDHATLPECVLSVTYNGTRAYHDYFPHSGGYTLADAAALEPGQSFEITIAGYFNASAAVGTDIISKGTAVEWTVAAGNVVEAYINGVNEADFTGVTTGYHVLNLRQIGGGAANRLEALVDGVITGTSAAAVTVPNNATAWTLGVALPYLEYLEMEVSGGKQVTHQIQGLPTQTLVNQANPGTHDSTIRYPETVDAPTVTVQSLEPTGVNLSADPDVSADFVPNQGELTNLDAGEHLNQRTNFVTIWLGVAADMSNGTVPYEALLILFAFGICVLAMLGSWYALHSVHITLFATTAASISFIFMGDGWWTWAVPLSFFATSLVYVVWRRASV